MTQTYHVKDWKPDADLNTGTPPLGAPEGHLRTNVNNIQREVIGAIRADWEGVAAAGGAWRDPNQGATVTRITGTQVTVGGLDVTHAFPVGRKVRISYSDEPGNNPGYAFVKTVAFVTDTTIDLEYFDDAAPDNTVRSGPSITSLSFYAAFGGGTAHQLGRAAFSDGTPGFIEPAALTAASIQLAIAAAAVNNDIVLLKAGTYVLEDTVAISADDRVWGRGVGVTILQAATGLNKTLIKFGDSCDDAELRDFSIDGNAVNQGGASIGIEGPSSGGGDRVRLHSLRISDTYSDGIKVNPTVTPCADWDLRDIEVVTTGEDCIHLAQPGAAITKVWLHCSHVKFRTPVWRSMCTDRVAAEE